MGGGSGGSIFKRDVSEALGWEKSTYDDLMLIPVLTVIAVVYATTIILTIARISLWNTPWEFVVKSKEAERKLLAFMLEGFFNMLHSREEVLELEESSSRGKKNAECKNDELHAEVESKLSEGSGSVGHMEDHLNDGECSNEKARHHHDKKHAAFVITAETIFRSKWITTLLSWYVATIATLTIVIFWVVFIANESIGCTSGKDCYFDNGTLISSCYTINAQVSKSALCYELDLDLPKTIAEVAGVLFLSANGFAFLMFLLLLVVDGLDTWMCRGIAFFVIGVLEYAFLAALVVSFVVRVEYLYKEDSFNIISVQALLSISMMMGVSGPWILLIWAFCSKREVEN